MTRRSSQRTETLFGSAPTAVILWLARLHRRFAPSAIIPRAISKSLPKTIEQRVAIHHPPQALCRRPKETGACLNTRFQFSENDQTQQKDRSLLSGLDAPQVGLEPTTLRLTAECSAIELLRNIGIRRRPTLPGRYQPSTIGTEGLNFCVRYVNRWDPFVITTGNGERYYFIAP